VNGYGTGATRTVAPAQRELRRPPDKGFRGASTLFAALAWAGLALALLAWWNDTPAGSINNRGELFVHAGRITGLIAGYTLLVQVLLRSRVGFVERVVGTERITRWHRDLGAALLVTVLAHAALILVGYAIVDRAGLLTELNVLMTEYEDMTSAVVATVILVLVGLLAVRTVRAVMPYELWKLLHLASYLVLLLSYGHQFANGQQLFRPGLGRFTWLVLYVGVLGCLIWGRVVAPFLLNRRHDFRVAKVVEEGPDVISIYLTGRELRETAQAGQFYRWRFLAPRLWTQAHPFSLSAATNPQWLRLTVKTVGKHTSALRRLTPGVRVWAQGPMGSFTASHRIRNRALLIAAGIGIAPIRALLEELPLRTVVIYRARSFDDVVLREELDRIAEERNATIWYVLGKRDEPGPRALLTGRGILQLVPDVKARDVYVCGPDGFIEAARTALRQAGVRRRQVHDTVFEF
jgi:predicted ferric reductase